jgi:hypothetical protein
MALVERALTIVVVNFIFLGISTIFFALRCWVRVSRNAFGLDDWLLALGWIMFVINVAFSTVAATHGLGVHNLNITVAEMGPAVKVSMRTIQKRRIVANTPAVLHSFSNLHSHWHPPRQSQRVCLPLKNHPQPTLQEDSLRHHRRLHCHHPDLRYLRLCYMSSHGVYMGQDDRRRKVQHRASNSGAQLCVLGYEYHH